jgi:hypothetical protein
VDDEIINNTSDIYDLSYLQIRYITLKHKEFANEDTNFPEDFKKYVNDVNNWLDSI